MTILTGIVGFYTHSIALIADAFHYVSCLTDWCMLGCFGWRLLQLNDLVSFIIALVALKVCDCWTFECLPSSNTRSNIQKSECTDSPKELSFGWQRAQLLGAFFNGVLLFGLGISIFLQSIERFIALQREPIQPLSTMRALLTLHSDVQNPKMMFIVGCVGLGLNLISAVFLHGMLYISRTT